MSSTKVFSIPELRIMIFKQLKKINFKNDIRRFEKKYADIPKIISYNPKNGSFVELFFNNHKKLYRYEYLYIHNNLKWYVWYLRKKIESDHSEIPHSEILEQYWWHENDKNCYIRTRETETDEFNRR